MKSVVCTLKLQTERRLKRRKRTLKSTFCHHLRPIRVSGTQVQSDLARSIHSVFLANSSTISILKRINCRLQCRQTHIWTVSRRSLIFMNRCLSGRLTWNGRTISPWLIEHLWSLPRSSDCRTSTVRVENRNEKCSKWAPVLRQPGRWTGMSDQRIGGWTGRVQWI